MTPSVPIQGSLTLSDYFAAQRLHYRPRPLVAVVLMVSVGALLLGAYMWHDWSLALFPAYMLAVYLVYVPLRGRRAFRQNKALAEPMTAEVRSDGIFFSLTHSSGLLPWSHIHKWKTNERITLIYRTSTMYHLIPVTFFQSAADRDAFVQVLRAKARAAT